MNVNVEVDVDDVLAELSDDEVQELYDERFFVTPSKSLWIEIYETRRAVTNDQFLEYIDKIIQDKTGRVLVWSV
jgi:hypothetical protein